MNCKPNELAFIVVGEGCHFKPEPENVGKVVRCLRLVPMAGMGPVWQIASEGSPLKVYWDENERDEERTALMEDANLRPIRPGAETQRETECLTQNSL